MAKPRDALDGSHFLVVGPFPRYCSACSKASLTTSESHEDVLVTTKPTLPTVATAGPLGAPPVARRDEPPRPACLTMTCDGDQNAGDDEPERPTANRPARRRTWCTTRRMHCSRPRTVLTGEHLHAFLEGRVERLGGGVPRGTDPPLDWVLPSEAHARANRSPTYLPPLSEWKARADDIATAHRSSHAHRCGCPEMTRTGSRRARGQRRTLMLVAVELSRSDRSAWLMSAVASVSPGWRCSGR